MRYTRLRRAIESGTLIGTHGTPFQGVTDKESGHQKKRKQPSLSARSEGTADLGPIQTRSGNSFERKAKVEEASSHESATGGTSEEDELPLIKKRVKHSSRCGTPPKHEVCSFGSPSPVLSHKPTAECGMPCDEQMDVSPTEHPLFKIPSNVDRLLSKMKIPKTNLKMIPATASKLEPQSSEKDPGAGSSTPALVSANYSQALCGTEDKQARSIDRKPSPKLRVNEKKAPFERHTEVHHSGQSFKNEVGEPGLVVKAENSVAEQHATLELADTKSTLIGDTLSVTGLYSILSDSHRVQEQAYPGPG